MRRISSIALLGFLTLLLAAFVAAEDPKPETPAETEETPESVRAKYEKDFAALLTESVLVGRFTTDGAEGKPGEPAPDRYEIGKVTKLKDDLWTFSGLKYGKADIPIPLIIRVVFADDTPMMTMNELTIPGLGTFSFRLIFHRDRYAGTWQHDDHGGHMWGKVERQPGKGKPAK